MFVVGAPNLTRPNHETEHSTHKTMNKAAKKDAVNWFELYVTDFDRSKKFYETALQTSLQESRTESCRMGIFPCDHTAGVGGAITKMDGISPGTGGTLVYLNVDGDLDGVLKRIPAAGGAVVKPRTSIGE